MFSSPSRDFVRSVALPLLILALVMAGVRSYAYVSARSLLKESAARNLEAIAKLKVDQIRQWQAERLEDAKLILTRQLSLDLQQWIAGGQRSRALEQRLRAQLEFWGGTHYADFSLLATDGTLLLTTNNHADYPIVRSQAIACATSGRPSFEDIHTSALVGGTETRTGIFFPVREVAGGQILAVLHLTLNPSEQLFPLLQTWPGVSASAETLLVRHEGDDVVFLNKLRHNSAAPLQLRLPMTIPHFIAPQVINKGTGFFEGNDYREIASLAYGMTVAGTSWYLIAKVDQNEVYGDLNVVMEYSSALLFLTLFAVAWWLVDRRRKEDVLRRALSESEDLYQNAACGYHSVDREGWFVRINDTELRMLGYQRDELIGKKRIQDLLTSESLRRFQEAYPQFVDSGKIQDFELEILRKDGSILTALVGGTAIRDSSGRYLMSRTTVVDITDRKKVDSELRIAATAFDSQEAMIITDANNVILRINQAFTLTTGYAAEEVVGQTPRMFKSGRHPADFFRDMWDSIKRTGGWRGEIWDRRKNGEVYPKWLTISAVKSDNGIVTHYIGAHIDISELKKAEDRIRELAFFDQLTGLPNRTLLIDRLRQMLAACSRNESYGALLFIDLDHFKTLNDTLGHEAGDLLLKQVTQRLNSCVREGDTVARLGGDEFVVALAGLSSNVSDAAAAIESVAEKILVTLGQPYQFGSTVYHGTASVGVTLFNGDIVTIDELMKQADLAMYKAKESGRNTCHFFDPQMESAVKERAVLEEELRQALVNKQFLLHYQAQVVGQGRLTGVEALIRWQHPSRGMVSPDEFIPLAEATGLILPLGQWVLETACAQLASWAARPTMSHLSVAVNVSARQFRQTNFVEQVMAVLSKTGANPGQLKLELTESMLVENVQGIVDKMFALRAKGVSFSLDDFGTGYSSLSYLKLLPLNQLKIDRSFVCDVLSDPNDAAIAKTVIALGQSLGLGVIAEGVETKEQRDFLAASGCHAYQGYLFARPLPLAEFEEFVNSAVGQKGKAIYGPISAKHSLSAPQ